MAYIYNIYIYDIVIPLFPAPSPPRRVCVLCVGALHCLLVFLCCLHVGASYYLLGLCSIVYWGFVYLTTPPSDPSHPLTRSSPFPPFNMYEVMWIDLPPSAPLRREHRYPRGHGELSRCRVHDEGCQSVHT